MIEKIRLKLEMTELQVKAGESLDIAMMLAVYGLNEMVAKHRQTGKQVATLQVLAGHLRKVIDLSGDGDAGASLEEVSRNIEKIFTKS